jgi:hypothetical protein
MRNLRLVEDSVEGFSATVGRRLRARGAVLTKPADGILPFFAAHSRRVS